MYSIHFICKHVYSTHYVRIKCITYLVEKKFFFKRKLLEQSKTTIHRYRLTQFPIDVIQTP